MPQPTDSSSAVGRLGMTRIRLRNTRDLEEVQLDGRLAPEEGYQYANLPLLGVDRIDDADEVCERAVHHFYLLVLREAYFDPWRLHLHATENALDFWLLERARMRASPDEAGYAGRIAYNVPGVVGRHAFVRHQHLDENVARENFALHGAALSVLDLDLFLGRDHDIVDLVADTHGLDAMLDVRFDFVLV